MKLSILICSLPERSRHFNYLMEVLGPQISDGVELLVDNRDKNIPTGTKRNELITKARGEWTVFIDDDDWIDTEYVKRILQALESNPDVVTFKGWMTTNGLHPVDWSIKLGEKYEARTDDDGVTRYYRFPNHLCPMRKSIAQRVKFRDIWQGEDYQWAKQINDMRLLRSEVHIDRKLYHYKFITGK
jgi:glycosyltransferase involved in cell wall biosynthesis